MGKGLLALWQKTKKSWRLAFFAAFVTGLLVHMYKFSNTLLNHDSIFSYYDRLNIIGSGRWFLSTACGFSSWFDLPWVNGILSLLFLSAAAVLIVDIFHMENPVVILLSSAIMVTFPGVTQTFFYEFTADGYCLAVFLAAFAVWLTRLEMNIHSYIYIYIFKVDGGSALPVPELRHLSGTYFLRHGAGIVPSAPCVAGRPL